MKIYKTGILQSKWKQERKTYVYTRSIFELNKLYGFSKFIIVVPSVAIREGVYKSFQMTEEHFTNEYPGQHCHYFKYDSSKLEQVREYATSTNIEVMIINIDAFKKSFDDPEKENKANLIHRERDTMNGKSLFNLFKKQILSLLLMSRKVLIIRIKQRKLLLH